MLQVVKLSENAILPKRESFGAAGYDLCSAESTVISSRSRKLIKTDLAISVPHGTYGRVSPRSGLALKSGIDVGAGVIDEDYRGPIGVILFNHSDTDFKITQGDRIAQLIIEQIQTPEVEQVTSLNQTKRGENGFGSTGF